MQPHLPDDVLLSVASHLSDVDLQGLLAVHPTFCHLAMRARYASVLLTDVDPDNLGRVDLISYLERLRDPFVSGYVRAATVKMKWAQKRWKKHGGMITRQPTSDEEEALVQTLAVLPTLNTLAFEWSSKPDPTAPARVFRALSGALGAAVTDLRLSATAKELDAFADAVEPSLMRGIRRLDVSANYTHEADPHGLERLGQCIALAGDVYLSSFRLRLNDIPHYVSTWRPLHSCFAALANSKLVDLRTLDLWFVFSVVCDRQGIDTLQTLFRRVKHTLDSLSLRVERRHEDSLEEYRDWHAQLATSVTSLRRLKLDCYRDGVHQDHHLQAMLPWITNSCAHLSDLTIAYEPLDAANLQHLLRVMSSCVALRCLNVTIERLAPDTLGLLATSCPTLMELDLRFEWLGPEGASNLDTLLMDCVRLQVWRCSHDLWQEAMDQFLSSCCAHNRQSWALEKAEVRLTRTATICRRCMATAETMLLAGVKHFVPSADILVDFSGRTPR